MSSEVVSDDLRDALPGYSNPLCSGANSLMQGQTNTFRYADGTDYEIKLSTISKDDQAKFIINNEVTTFIATGSSYIMADGEEFIVTTVSTNSALFCINGAPALEIVGTTPLSPGAPSARAPILPKEKDECVSNSDCNDNNACTTDLCSGKPKKCSNTEISMGCNYNGNCIPVGVRVENNYCDIDRNIKSQLDAGESCNNNYECSSNVCVNSECISPNFIQKIINWLKKLFGG